jgi:hypothetical protein
MPLAEVVQAYNRGEISAETYLWADGMSDWTPLGEVPEVVDALHAAASELSSPQFEEPIPSAPKAGSSPWAARSPAAAAAPAAGNSPWGASAAPVTGKAPRESDAAVARAAARKGAARGQTADLFGSFDANSADDEVATSAPHPDLAAATGARNESSVLFSLSSLTASAKTAPSGQSKPGTPPSGSKEDSGLIDLRALTTNAAGAQPDAPAAESFMASPLGGMSPFGGAPLGGAPLGDSPLGLAPPLGVVEAQHGAAALGAKGNKTGLIIAGAIVIAALVIVFAFILRPSAPAPSVAPGGSAPTQPGATAENVPNEQPTAVTAKPPATGTADETSADAGAAAKPPAVHAPATHHATKKPSDESNSNTSAAPEKKPAVKRSPCGCAPSDLQCAMRCAAGR